MSATHSSQTAADGIHIATRWEYASITARDAATYASTDIGGVARVGSVAPYDFYILVNHTGPVFDKLGGPSADLDPAAASLDTNPAELDTILGTNFPFRVLKFDADTDEQAYWSFRLRGYSAGNITAFVRWYADSASSGNVVWGVSLASITPDADTTSVETKAFASENSVTDAHLGTTPKRLHQAVVTVSNLDSAATDDWATIRLRRIGSDIADTMSGDASVVQVVLIYH